MIRCHLLTEYPYTAFIIFQKCQHTVDHLCFTRSVWSQKSENFPFPNIQIQMIQGNKRTVSFYKIFYLYDSIFLKTLCSTHMGIKM